MSSTSQPTITAVSESSVNRLLKQTNAWCGVNGLMYTDGKVNWTPAPLSLIPNAFSSDSLLYAFKMQPIINKLVDGISRDREFLLDKLSTVSESDEFTKRILQLYMQVPESVVKNDLQCGILRSDYMINNDHRALQVEINTIASSFGYLSKKVSDYHRYILERNEKNEDLHTIVASTLEASFASAKDAKTKVKAQNVLNNPSSVELAKVLALAHQQCKSENAAVLFIVQPNERNIADQRAFELQLWEAHRVPVEFLTLAEVHARARLEGPSEDWGKQSLVIGPAPGTVGSEFTVSVAYFRAGYTPYDYPTEDEWAARKVIEQSSAVKCPNTGYQLAGTKAIQASLCLPGVLERFLTVEESVELRRCFAAQYSLVALTDLSAEGAELRTVTEQAVAQATADGAPWVLKPQREGGGNNLYGVELSNFLKEHAGQSVLSGYVLMQRIFPLPQKTAFLRAGALQILPSISELGVYGTYLSYGACPQETTNEEKVLCNAYGGYLLRTKPEGVDEGGVASGYSVLSSVILE